MNELAYLEEYTLWVIVIGPGIKSNMFSEKCPFSEDDLIQVCFEAEVVKGEDGVSFDGQCISPFSPLL